MFFVYDKKYNSLNKYNVSNNEKYSSTSIAGMVPYELCSVFADLNPHKNNKDKNNEIYNYIISVLL
jgi:hypothetical protein